jgi:hypothetical protein
LAVPEVSNGGQFAWQAALHPEASGASLTSTYRVRPVPSVRNLPNVGSVETSRVGVVAVDPAVVETGWVDGSVAIGVAAEAQAATIIANTASKLSRPAGLNNLKNRMFIHFLLFEQLNYSTLGLRKWIGRKGG